MSKIITEHEARALFDQGWPVAPSNERGTLLGGGWQSVVTGWARTFDGLIEDTRRSYGDIDLIWRRPTPSRRTRDEAAGFIFRREEFEVGRLSGTHFFSAPDARGDLPEKYHAWFYEADYAVWSYETPIAWVERVGDAEIIWMPPVRYSLTTTEHQYLAARALGVKFAASESANKGCGHSPYGPRAGGGY